MKKTSGMIRLAASSSSRAEVLDERPAVGVPALAHDRLVDLIACRHVLGVVERQAVLGRQPDGPVERDPALELRIDEVLPAAADLPDPLVGPVPVVDQPVHHPADRLPEVVGDAVGVLVEEVDRVHHLAVDVQLELVGRGVADADRLRAAVAVEVVEVLLGQFVAAVDART